MTADDHAPDDGWQLDPPPVSDRQIREVGRVPRRDDNRQHLSRPLCVDPASAEPRPRVLSFEAWYRGLLVNDRRPLQ